MANSFDRRHPRIGIGVRALVTLWLVVLTAILIGYGLWLVALVTIVGAVANGWLAYLAWRPTGQ